MKRLFYGAIVLWGDCSMGDCSMGRLFYGAIVLWEIVLWEIVLWEIVLWEVVLWEVVLWGDWVIPSPKKCKPGTVHRLPLAAVGS